MCVRVYPALQECADLESALITLLKATFKTYKKYFDSIHQKMCWVLFEINQQHYCRETTYKAYLPF